MEEENHEKAELPPDKGKNAPILKNGCYSLTAQNQKKWYNILTKHYYDKVDDDDDNEKVDWDDRNQSTLIKYNRTDKNLSITITLHNTGTLVVQGSQKPLNIYGEMNTIQS